MAGTRVVLPRPVLRLFASRWTLLALNLAVTVIAVASLWDMYPLLGNAVGDLHVLEDISDAVGTILIAYGVAAEERETLMKFMGFYPDGRSAVQDDMDHASHYFGLAFLVIGLFMEMGVQLIKIPDDIVNTQGLEDAIFTLNAVFILLALALMFRYCQRVWNAGRDEGRAPA